MMPRMVPKIAASVAVEIPRDGVAAPVGELDGVEVGAEVGSEEGSSVDKLDIEGGCVWEGDGDGDGDGDVDTERVLDGDCVEGEVDEDSADEGAGELRPPYVHAPSVPSGI